MSLDWCPCRMSLARCLSMSVLEVPCLSWILWSMMSVIGPNLLENQIHKSWNNTTSTVQAPGVWWQSALDVPCAQESRHPTCCQEHDNTQTRQETDSSTGRSPSPTHARVHAPMQWSTIHLLTPTPPMTAYPWIGSYVWIQIFLNVFFSFRTLHTVLYFSVLFFLPVRLRSEISRLRLRFLTGWDMPMLTILPPETGQLQKSTIKFYLYYI